MLVVLVVGIDTGIEVVTAAVNGGREVAVLVVEVDSLRMAGTSSGSIPWKSLLPGTPQAATVMHMAAAAASRASDRRSISGRSACWGAGR